MHRCLLRRPDPLAPWFMFWFLIAALCLAYGIAKR